MVRHVAAAIGVIGVFFLGIISDCLAMKLVWHRVVLLISFVMMAVKSLLFRFQFAFVAAVLQL